MENITLEKEKVQIDEFQQDSFVYEMPNSWTKIIQKGTDEAFFKGKSYTAKEAITYLKEITKM